MKREVKRNGEVQNQDAHARRERGEGMVIVNDDNAVDFLSHYLHVLHKY